MKFFGLPPPQMRTADFPPPRLAERTIDAVSLTSRFGSIVHLFPSRESAATFLPQHDVGLLRVAAMHREPKSKVRVVIQVRASRDDPIDEPTLDERDDRRH